MAMGNDSGDSGRPLTQINTRSSLDLATVVGIGVAISLVLSAIILGGSAPAFIDYPSILIVIGGTFGITTACFSFGDILSSGRVIAGAILRQKVSPHLAATQLLQLAQIARFKGVLSVQEFMSSLDSQPMLQQGLTMVIDGTPGDDVERIMQREVQAIAQRQTISVSILKKAADISPAMGLIGTLVGLVQMLGNLDDPNTIGPSMAVALLTTFYGASLANMVFTPLAAKMERNASEEMLLNHLYVMATASIGRQENPRRLEMLLNTILPPNQRVEYFG